MLIATAVASVVNGGVYHAPSVISTMDGQPFTPSAQNTTPRRVISEEASEQVRSLMEQQALNQKSNSFRIDGYRIGTKTGTARLVSADCKCYRGESVVSTIGAALTPEPAAAKGFTLERTYYTLDGKEVDLKSAKGGTSTLAQTDRMVVVLKVKAAETGGRILLVDRLPAGLEIENPRIVDSGDLKSFAWLKTTLKPQHSEFRDDRFVAAFDFFGKSGRHNSDGDDDDAPEPASEATVAYVVRAVTPGTFVHPAATVEDMYNPERFARTASGRLEVKAKD